jgi:hypothetical protein
MEYFGVESRGWFAPSWNSRFELRRDWRRSLLGARWKFKWAGLLFGDAVLAAAAWRECRSQPQCMQATTLVKDLGMWCGAAR